MGMNPSPISYESGRNTLNKFMSEGEERRYDFDFQYKFNVVEESSHVTELIGNDWWSWTPISPVMISTQTGTGKNTFITKIILRNMLTYNREHPASQKMLIVLNRTALRRQTLIQIANVIAEYTGNTYYLEELNNYTDSGLDKNLYSMGNIYIVTYQYFNSDEGINLLSKTTFHYAIFDECHFFTSDALFNPNTDKILVNIVKYCSKAIRIYMSSTIETAFEPIIRAEYRMWHYKKNPPTEPGDIISSYNQSAECVRAYMTGDQIAIRRIGQQQIQHFIESNEKFTVKFYDLERDYSYVEKLQSISLSNLVEQIAKKDGKWLIFVGCREDGRKLKADLDEQEIEAAFLTSDSKTSTAFHGLVKKEQFTQKVLIATSVIDNGINIKDEKITDIVIFPFDRVEFLQMLGRLRIEDKATKKINIWVASWEEKGLKELLKNDVKKLIDRLILDPLDKKTRDSLANEYIENKRAGFGISSQEGLYYNPNSLYILLESIQRISKILSNSSCDFKLDWNDDNSYRGKLLKVFYNATANRGMLPDAVCRTLLQLNFADDMDYLRKQVRWKISNDTDDSFLYQLYQKRIDNLNGTLSVRERQKQASFFMEKIPTDEHPMLSDAALRKKIRRLEKLRDRYGKAVTAYEEQYFWLELDVPVVKNTETEGEINNELLLHNNSVTTAEFQANIIESGKDFTCSDSHFLSHHGFYKDALENKGGEKDELLRAAIFKRILAFFQSINAKCDTATKLMKYLKKNPYIVLDNLYTMESVKSTATKKTYYFIIETNHHA